jgi:hypothetical protein
MSQLPAFRALALSLIVFGLSVGAAVLGTRRDGLFADPGRPGAQAPFEAPSAR